ncbi:MAG: DUF5119 domain-containing protein [Mucinivorans sp.]
MRHFLYILVLLLLGSSCKRDHLYYGVTDKALLGVNIDWAPSQMTPNGATVVAYNDDGSLYEEFPYFSNPNRGIIALPVGRYTLVVYNNTPGEYRHLSFREAFSQNTYRASAIDKEKPLRGFIGLSNSIPTIVEDPEMLASARTMGVSVTRDMVEYYYDRPAGPSHEVVSEITLTPARVITLVHVKAHVMGLCYAAGAPVTHLRNLSGDYYLGQGCNSARGVTHEFILNNRVFDPGTTRNGTISHTFNSFGLITDGSLRANTRYFLDIDFRLVDGRIHPLSFDVTDLIHSKQGLTTCLTVEVNITLPEAIGGDGDGAFDTDVEPWDDVHVDIPM